MPAARERPRKTNSEAGVNSQEAKVVLLRYRPDSGDAADPEVAAALAVVETDADLKAWFDRHCAFQREIRIQFGAIPVPENLLLPPNVVVGPAAWWSKLGAAAAVLLAVGISLWLWFKPEPTNRFENYRSRIARSVLRDYRMDLKTNDMTRLREFLARKGAPADYEVPPALAPMALTGGGVHTWRGKPVSMVCFDPGAKPMVFLFVVDRGGIRDLPPSVPEFARVSRLVTASWTDGSKAYLLATEAEDESALRKYL